MQGVGERVEVVERAGRGATRPHKVEWYIRRRRETLLRATDGRFDSQLGEIAAESLRPSIALLEAYPYKRISDFNLERLDDEAFRVSTGEISLNDARALYQLTKTQ